MQTMNLRNAPEEARHTRRRLPRRAGWLAPVAGVFLFAAACGKEPDAPPEAAETAGAKATPLAVYTTFYPTWFFVEAIGGEHVNAVNPIPPDEDPIFYQPPPETIVEYQEKADLIVLNGADYAKWVSRVMLPEGKIVNAGAAFEDDLIVIEGATTHSHGPAGEHTHAGIDGHTWMDPHLAMEQCRAIAAALKNRDPAHAADYDRGLDRVLAGLRELDALFLALKEQGRDEPIVASHPAYNYLCRRYGWTVKSFDFDPAERPEPGALLRLKQFLDAHPGITYMVWEEAPAEDTASVFKAECGLEPLVFAPVETPPPAGLDYFDVMKQNAENIRPLFTGS